MRRPLLSLLLGLAVLCGASCSGPQSPSSEKSKMTHPNGLTVVPPPALTSEQTSDGFVFRPENWRNMRSPKEIRIEVRTSEPAGTWPSGKTLNGTAIHYRIDSRQGGSGGEERVLEAWKQAGSRWIWLSESTQSETPSDADFNDGWSLLDKAEAPKV